ncbi:MAG: hypothetical protein GY936_06210 [Ignavibacteriae bacterium]|nr:hypothetical protein [Ignavibacteriota bacterium]
MSAFIFSQCKEKGGKDIEQNRLKLKDKILLKVPEPSGITHNKNSNSLLIVSDESSRIYKLSTDGKIYDSLEVNGFDLEGITYLNDSTLVTILERDRTVVTLTDKGKELSRFNIDLYGKPNSGLEGITFNPNNNHLYVLNEKNPCLLLELGLDGKVFSKKELKFAKDLSGIFFDELKNELWITSHENKSAYKCTTDGTVLNSYSIGVPQAEGIAIDFEMKKIFLVCDKSQSLLIYLLP